MTYSELLHAKAVSHFSSLCPLVHRALWVAGNYNCTFYKMWRKLLYFSDSWSHGGPSGGDWQAWYLSLIVSHEWITVWRSHCIAQNVDDGLKSPHVLTAFQHGVTPLLTGCWLQLQIDCGEKRVVSSLSSTSWQESEEAIRTFPKYAQFVL